MRFGLEEATIAKINTVFTKYTNIKEVKIYGSRAKGTHKNGSDIDLVLFTSQPDNNELAKLKMEIDDLLLPYSVDLNDYADIHNNELKEHIDRIGRFFFKAIS